MNFKSLEEQLKETRTRLIQLEAEKQIRQEAQWGCYIFVDHKRPTESYRLAVAIARTELEAREAIDYELSQTDAQYNVNELQIIFCCNVEDASFEELRSPLAYFSGEDRDYLPF